jgi:hypothetical protein
MKSHQLATELAKLAEHLNAQPDMDLGDIRIANHSCTGEQFKAIAKVMPKPLHKRITNDSLDWIYLETPDGAILAMSFHAERKRICTLITPAQPAVYACEPLLSDEEIEAL